MSFSRRELLASVLPGCVAVWFLHSGKAAGNAEIDPLLTSFAERAFRPSGDLHCVGAACVASLGGPVALLQESGAIRDLHESARGMTTRQLQELLRQAIQSDFADDRTVDVQGLVLARTEAVCMGLASIAMEANGQLESNRVAAK